MSLSAPVDLLFRNVRLASGPDLRCVAVDAGRIVSVGEDLDVPARETVDGGGFLLSPPFVDAHFHMDATLSAGQPRWNDAGTLLEGIRIWGEQKALLTVEAIRDRALSYCALAVSQGLLHIRSHVDICDPRLLGVHALLEVRERVAPILDLQLVAFPQDGLYRDPTAATLLHRALDLGVDVVGGIPHHERTTDEGRRSVAYLLRLAAERGLRVDLHCDETDDPNSRHVETLAAETLANGLQGRVTGSHLTSMHSMPTPYVDKLIPLMAEAGLSVVANPLVNTVLQGRYDGYPRRRGMTRVPELLEAKIPVAFGQDCAMDPWYPLGSGDMLDVAHMGLHIAQLTSKEGMNTAFECVTTRAAQVMGLDAYGISPGNPANFVLLQAATPIEALRTRAARLQVWRNGHRIASSPGRQVHLTLPWSAPALSMDPT